MISSTCAHCGESLAPTARFCALCGTPRPEEYVPGAPGGVAASAAAPTTTMPTAPPAPPAAAPPMTGSSWASSSAPAARPAGPPAADRVKQSLLGSLEPATVMVFTAAALAFGLPSFVYAYASPHGFGFSNATKTVLALLLLVALGLGAIGAWAAWSRIRDWAEERTAARLVFGVGVFASVLSLLELFAALGR